MKNSGFSLWCPDQENCDKKYPSHTIAIPKELENSEMLEKMVKTVGFDYMDTIGTYDFVKYFGEGFEKRVLFIVHPAQFLPFKKVFESKNSTKN